MKLAILFSLLILNQTTHAKNCSYSADPKSLMVQWTAFKTTQKVPVSGKFSATKNKKPLEKSYSSLSDLLKAAHIEVDMHSVDSAAPLRDETLKQKFFEALKDKAMAHASLVQIKENPDQSGTANMNLKFNGQTKKIPMTFTYDKETFILKGKMDLLNFTAHKALKSLNKACFDLHKGADGVSKTWSEVEISATAKIAEICN